MSSEDALDQQSEISAAPAGDPSIVTAPFHDVLVPMDRDVIGREGLERLTPIIQCCGATVHLLYVRWDPAFGAYKRDRLRYDPDEDLKRMGNQFKEEMAARGLEVNIEHRKGTPHRQILDYALENDIDLIIMTTHGRSGLNLLLQGSVTQSVIRDSSAPVMVMTQKA